MITTIHGLPLHDAQGSFDEAGKLVLVEATPEHGERRIYYPHQVKMDYPLRRKGDYFEPEGQP